MARRYHWHSPTVRDFTAEPHTAIIGEPQGTILNLVDARASRARQALLTLAREPIESSITEMAKLSIPARHDVHESDVDLIAANAGRDLFNVRHRRSRQLALLFRYPILTSCIPKAAFTRIGEDLLKSRDCAPLGRLEDPEWRPEEASSRTGSTAQDWPQNEKTRPYSRLSLRRSHGDLGLSKEGRDEKCMCLRIMRPGYAFGERQNSCLSRLPAPSGSFADTANGKPRDQTNTARLLRLIA
jgi:hypothetical protein